MIRGFDGANARAGPLHTWFQNSVNNCNPSKVMLSVKDV